MKHDRNLQARAGRVAPGRPKRSMSVQQALEWAFRVEHAQLELPEPPDPEREQGFGFGLEYVLLQRAILGCKIDGGHYKIGSYTHEDAEVIAATVAGMPDSLGDGIAEHEIFARFVLSFATPEEEVDAFVKLVAQG